MIGYFGPGFKSPQLHHAFTGERSLKIYNLLSSYWGYAEQSILLDKGVYCISIDVLNIGYNSNPVTVKVGSQIQEVVHDDDWQKMTFIVPIVDDDTVEIHLESHTQGTVYYDNVTVSSGADSSWVNLVENPSFENGITSNWNTTSGTTLNEYSINDQSGALNELYEEVLGERAIGLNGKVYTEFERNYFDENTAGGGIIYFGGWALNYTAPSINNANTVDGKSVGIYVEQLSGTSVISNTRKLFAFNLSYDNWQYIYGDFSLDSQCTSVRIGFQYEGEGEVLFDGLSVFFAANTTTYAYDQYGRIMNVYFENGTIYTYSYTPGEDPATHLIPESITDNNNHSVSIVSSNNQITDVIKNNVKSSPVFNNYGQIEGYRIQSSDETITYYSTSTSYDINHQYLLTSTNEFEETTTYYTDVINGLIDHINNAKGVDTNYEYYDNGALRKVYIDNSYTNERTYVEYVYDEFNLLHQIILGEDYSYYLNYDLMGRIESVQVNNQTLMSYDYWVNTYETEMISSQTFPNGDAIYFQYDSETNNITEILFRASGMSPVIRFQYEYDSLGRISVYHDIIKSTVENYMYDSDGNLSQISYSNGDQVNYAYDDNGNPSTIVYDISNATWNTSYDFHESMANADQYDQTSLNYNSTTIFVKDYIYQSFGINDPLGRLVKVEYHTTINGINYPKYYTVIGYDEDLTRINLLTFEFQGYSYRNFQYSYTYDELGNFLSETYRTYNTTTFEYNDVVTKKYMYDDLNQLIQESLNDTRVDCSNVSNIDSCFIKTYEYDSLGNITSQKTYKYFNTTHFVVEGPIPQSYETNIGNSDMFVYYSGTNRYYNTYSIPVGGSLSLTYTYYDMYAFPLQKILKVFTSVDSSGVDVNTPGYYLLEATAHDLVYEYELEFGIVVKVGDVVAGELVNEQSFTYNLTWLDQLESYTIDKNGVSTTSEITYDFQGNPIQITNFYYNGTKYNHASLSWEGRQLTNIKIYSGITTKIAEIWYSYNVQGLRVSKILDTDGNDSLNKKYQYVWSGDLVISEIVSNYSSGNWVEQYQVNYIIDYDGSLIGFKYCVGTSTSTFFYVTNIHGDITKIINYYGYVYAEYTYDSYGNINSISGPNASTYGQYNSYRYRSYKYDSEIGIYYLNTRYYNPEIGRFINSDESILEVNSLYSSNMYNYCYNNPISLTLRDVVINKNNGTAELVYSPSIYINGDSSIDQSVVTSVIWGISLLFSSLSSTCNFLGDGNQTILNQMTTVHLHLNSLKGNMSYTKAGTLGTQMKSGMSKWSIALLIVACVLQVADNFSHSNYSLTDKIVYSGIDVATTILIFVIASSLCLPLSIAFVVGSIVILEVLDWDMDFKVWLKYKLRWD